jgi:hypothetical protein
MQAECLVLELPEWEIEMQKLGQQNPPHLNKHVEKYYRGKTVI